MLTIDIMHIHPAGCKSIIQETTLYDIKNKTQNTYK